MSTVSSQGADLPRSRQLGGSPIAVERGEVPEAIEVLIDPAGRRRIVGIEGLISIDVHEAEAEPALGRANVVLKQPFQGDGAAGLVAMNDGADHHMRAGLS